MGSSSPTRAAEARDRKARDHDRGQSTVADHADDIVWFGEFDTGKIGRFDPKTEKFEEFPLPGPEASPYAIGVDKDGIVWYSSHEQDTLGRLDPKTGAMKEYVPSSAFMPPHAPTLPHPQSVMDVAQVIAAAERSRELA